MFILRVNGFKHSAYNTKDTAIANALKVDGKTEVEYDPSVQVAHGHTFKGGR